MIDNQEQILPTKHHAENNPITDRLDTPEKTSESQFSLKLKHARSTALNEEKKIITLIALREIKTPEKINVPMSIEQIETEMDTIVQDSKLAPEEYIAKTNQMLNSLHNLGSQRIDIEELTRPSTKVTKSLHSIQNKLNHLDKEPFYKKLFSRYAKKQLINQKIQLERNVILLEERKKEIQNQQSQITKNINVIAQNQRNLIDRQIERFAYSMQETYSSFITDELEDTQLIEEIRNIYIYRKNACSTS